MEFPEYTINVEYDITALSGFVLLNIDVEDQLHPAWNPEALPEC